MSPGDCSGMDTWYLALSSVVTLGSRSAETSGMSRATSTSSARTRAGGSSVPNENSACAAYGSGLRDRFVNDPPASSAVGITTMPLPVSRCTARQFTSMI